MKKVITLCAVCITLASCTSIEKMATSTIDGVNNFLTTTTYTPCEDVSRLTKDSFVDNYSLSEVEYKQWLDGMIATSDELCRKLEATPVVWENGNELSLLKSHQKIKISESKVSSVHSVWRAETPYIYDDEADLLLFSSNGIYSIFYHSRYGGVIFTCQYSNFESLSKKDVADGFGTAGKALLEQSNNFFSKQMPEKITKKKRTIKTQVVVLVRDINNRRISTLKIRDLYLGMPADECAILLNYYLELPSNSEPYYYKYYKDRNVISFATLNSPEEVYFSGHCMGVENGEVTRLDFSSSVANRIFNAESLTTEEFAQALVDSYPLVSSLTPTLNQNLSTHYETLVYDWKYTNTKAGFRLTLGQGKALIIDAIAKKSELNF